MRRLNWRHGALLAAALLLALSAAVFLRARGHHAPSAPAESAAAPEGSGEEAGDEAGNVRRRDNWFYAQRAYPNKFTPAGALTREIEQARVLRAATRARASESRGLAVPTLAWTSIGPAPISAIASTPGNDGRPNAGVPPLAGRITAIANDPTSADTAYIGGAYGGVWKTTNGGTNWAATSDSLPSLAIGAIAIDPTAHNTIYVGTGEANGAQDSYYGAGVFKSTNGGATWVKVGGTTFDGCHVSDIAVDTDATHNVVLVAVSEWPGVTNPACPSANRGMWRSTNGGANWAKATTTYTDATHHETPESIAVDPAHAGTLYAGYWLNGLFKSTDFGATWTQLSTYPGRSSDVGRTEVAVSSDGAKVYTLSEKNSTGDYLGVYRSVDGGATWTAVSGTKTDLCGFSSGSGQCWYDEAIAVKPGDATTFFAAGTTVNKFTASGDTGAEVSYPNKIHVDTHALSYDITGRLWVGNDGGVFRTSNDGSTYSDLNATLVLAQFSRDISGKLAGPLLGGTQDNGTLAYGGALGWPMIRYGDGGASAVDPGNTNLRYASNFGSYLSRTADGGTSWTVIDPPTGGSTLFYPPIIMDPTTSTTLYFGATTVWRTINASTSASWGPLAALPGSTRYVSAIGPAKSSSAVLYAGTSGGQLYVTTNGGSFWTNTTANGIPNRWVTDIEVKPDSASTAYVTVSGFGTGHVFKTIDSGAHWANVSGNLPNAPVNAVAVDYGAATPVVYVGTDVGVFWSSDGGVTWNNSSTGLPNTAVIDLKIDPSGKLVGATHGRGMFTAPLVAPAVSLAPTSLAFGDVGVGVTSAGQTVTATNTGGSNLVVTSIGRGGANPLDFIVASQNCTAAPIPAGGSCTVTVKGKPTATGARAGRILFNDNAPASPQYASLTMTGTPAPAVGLSPTSLAFGDVKVGFSSAGQTVTITNTGSANLHISGFGRSGTNPLDFSVVSQNCTGAAIIVGGTCSVTVKAKPLVTGPRSGRLLVMDDAGNSPQVVPLTVNGTPAPVVSLSPALVDFGSVPVSTTSSQMSITITNVGSDDLTITGFGRGGANPLDFALASQDCTGHTIAPGAFCTAKVTARPTTTGTRTGNLLITDNAGNSPQAEKLKVTGT